MTKNFGNIIAEALELEQEWLEAVSRGEYEGTFQDFCKGEGKEYLAQYIFIY